MPDWLPELARYMRLVAYLWIAVAIFIRAWFSFESGDAWRGLERAAICIYFALSGYFILSGYNEWLATLVTTPTVLLLAFLFSRPSTSHQHEAG